MTPQDETTAAVEYISASKAYELACQSGDSDARQAALRYLLASGRAYAAVRESIFDRLLTDPHTLAWLRENGSPEVRQSIDELDAAREALNPQDEGP